MQSVAECQVTVRCVLIIPTHTGTLPVGLLTVEMDAGAYFRVYRCRASNHNEVYWYVLLQNVYGI